jgi:hypothetical protein
LIWLLATLAGSPQSRRKGAEIHKRLRMQNTDGNVAYLYPYKLG